MIDTLKYDIDKIIYRLLSNQDDIYNLDIKGINNNIFECLYNICKIRLI